MSIDVTVVGSGPSGLSAAVTLARAGLSVRVLERASTIGGGLRTSELTLPGFRHDVCSAVHPAALASPFFRLWGLEQRVPFVVPELSFGHPLDGAPAGLAWRDLDRATERLGRDGLAYRRLLEPLVRRIEGVVDFTGHQLLRVPADPIAAVRFGLRALEQGTADWNTRFRDGTAPAMLTGVLAHANARLPSLAAAGTGLLLGAHAHARGWGLPIGGSQSIADALADDLRAHGGIIETDAEVRSPADVGDSRAVILDTSPEFLLRYAAGRLPDRYARAVGRYRRGHAIAKVDFALAGPIPWADPELGAAPTVHLGGTRREIAEAENAVGAGRVPERPYVLLVQPTVVDASRAPAGKHIAWAYLHVPRGVDLDATELITAQVERFAPGFRDLVLAAAPTTAADAFASNPNDVGGDILGGAVTIGQLLKRPVVSRAPWRTPVHGLYLASAATPPGPGVHGMNGWFAARAALHDVFGISETPFGD